MREFKSEGPRSEGPPVVWAGRDEGPALVVVDPSGAARHDDLPATWHRLAEQFQVAWCRVPASRRSLEDIEDVLETLAERHWPTNLVAGGDACGAAIAIAHQFGDVVHSVLLVDPAEPGDPDDAAKLSDSGVSLQVVARSHGGDTDRVEAPMPLGHPEVVRGVVSALAGLSGPQPSTVD